MIHNTSDLVRTIKIWAGGVALLTAGAVGLTVFKTVKGRKKYHRSFNPKSLKKLTGEITNIFSPDNQKHNAEGVILTVSSGKEEFEVHLGPYWYISRQFKRFKEGEKISVTGSLVNYRDHDILVVQTLRRGKNTYRLRDEYGSPFWKSKVD